MAITGIEDPRVCECGCGLPAPLAPRTNTRFGHIKGQPLRFRRGHTSRRPGFVATFMRRVERATAAEPRGQLIIRDGSLVGLVPVFRRGSVVAEALVDPGDLFEIERVSWTLHTGGYAQHGAGLYLHRLVARLRPGDSWVVDHLNGDKLDNRRANLLVVDAMTNAQNRIYEGRGAHLHRQTGKWVAMARVAGQRTYLGLFTDRSEAVAAAAAFRAEHMPGSAEYRGR